MNSEQGGLEMRGCIHQSTGSPDSQAPEEAFSEELGEWGGWVAGGKEIRAPRALIMEAGGKGVST